MSYQYIYLAQHELAMSSIIVEKDDKWDWFSGITPVPIYLRLGLSHFFLSFNIEYVFPYSAKKKCISF